MQSRRPLNTKAEVSRQVDVLAACDLDAAEIKSRAVVVLGLLEEEAFKKAASAAY